MVQAEKEKFSEIVSKLKLENVYTDYKSEYFYKRSKILSNLFIKETDFTRRKN